MDKLKAMATFVHIAEAGSLTAAAKASASSLPAVVRSLAALEGHLGVRLFNRTTRRISLTAEGRHYLDRCRAVLDAVAEAEGELAADAAEPSGELVVTAPALFGEMYVAPAVTRFVQRYDKVRVRLLLWDRVVNLLDEGIDVAVRIGELNDSSLVAQAVGSLRRPVVASPEFLRRHGVPGHPDELRHANCIRFTGLPAGGWLFHDGRRQFQVPVTGNLEFNRAAPAASACVAGLGFGMFISYQVAPDIAAGRLQTVLEPFEPPPRPVNLVYPHARGLPARTRVFIAWMKEALAPLGG
ncbi:LysR family transcriptional regulator [Rhizobacter sp. LjRoot28]|uniref:LysR family transcriptional regulator n=1 Tax=Rhizobacter sp. LjRoot28 TaxID=3342309 RepID=UPI003ECF84D7